MRSFGYKYRTTLVSDCFKEMLCYLETSACHLAPEVLVLLNVFLYSWGIADDAETNEGHIIYIAGMGEKIGRAHV